MKKLLWTLVLLPLVFAQPALAATIVARVDLSQQQMRVYVNGAPRYTWAVSTGAGRYRTPTGTYRPQRLEVDWHSRKYGWAPMPFSIFYHRGYAIHGTNAISKLGRPASHGCVRLHPTNAKRLFSLVSRYGMRNMRIEVVR